MKTLKTKFLSLLFFIMLSSCTFNASLKSLEVELGKGDQSSTPVNLQKIFVDITSVTLTEGSVAIINVAVNPVQTTDTVINLNLTTSGSSYIRFNPIPSQIIIPAGSTSKSVVLNTIDDSLVQDQEMWSFSISTPDPNLQADPGILNVTLNDNDGGVIPGGPVVTGAKLLKEFNAYPASVNKIVADGKVFYVGSDASNGAELWISDGTSAGTHLVKDIEPGTGSSSITSFYHPPLSPYVFFIATTSSENTELWVTDGTEQGTHIITKGYDPGTGSGAPTIYLAHKDKLYYSAVTTVDGRELYVTDGTNAGTYMLYESTTGTSGIGYTSLLADGDDVYFSMVISSVFESHIFKTDGTIAGTTRLVTADKNGTPISDQIVLDSFANGYLFFNMYDWSGGYELHSSGLTNATTGMVADLYPGWNSSYASTLNKFVLNNKAVVIVSSDNSGATTGYYLSDGTTAGTTKVTQPVYISSTLGMIGGNKLIFSGCTNGYNCELYSTSGVSGDAVLLKDINPGTTSGNGNSSSPALAAKVGNKIFFTATTATEGIELWVTDGTSAGTVFLKDIYPGATSSSPSNFIVMGTKLLFTAKSPTLGEEIWISDGTPAGTTVYRDLFPGSTGSGPKNLVALDSNRLFFTAYNSLSGFASVFITDISNLNTNGLAHAMVESLNSETKNLVEFNGLVYFDAMDSSSGSPLWVTNGTVAGTSKIKDLFPTISCVDINYMTTYSGSLFFVASTETNGLELHKSDGTTAGTGVVKDLNGTSTGSGIGTFFKTDIGNMFFTGNHDPNNYGTELYTTDGTSAGTMMVKDLNPGSTASLPAGITPLPGTNKIVFYTWTPKSFWVSDGTSAGTVTLSGFGTINSNSYPPIANPTGAYLFHSDTSNRIMMYQLNSATNSVVHFNTTYTTDIPTGAMFANPTTSTLYFFTNNSGGTSLNLWKSDGTSAGTVMVKNIPLVGNNYGITPIGHIGNKSIFQYHNNTSSPYVRQLWVTDGTAAGTSVIDTATNTEMVNYTAGINYNGYLYFTRYHATAGVELWKTDGTSANTLMVKDINPGASGSSFTPLAVYKGKLYFTATDGVHGSELWRTDGSLLGTEMVTDINPGLGSSTPANAKVLGDKLYFIAYKVLSGKEVWVYSE